MKNWFNVFLLIATVVGLSFSVGEGIEQRDLSQRYQILAAEVGYLNPSAEEGLQVITLKDGGRSHFRWRVCIPDKHRMKVNTFAGVKYVEGPANFIAHARFRDGEDGESQVWLNFEDFEMAGSFVSPRWRQLLAERWDGLEVDQLGGDGKEVIKPDETRTLLRIRMPDNMQADAQQVLSPEAVKQAVSVLYELRVKVENVDQPRQGIRTGEGDSKP